MNFEERIALFREDHVRMVRPSDADRLLVVEETSVEGQARVTFAVPCGRRGLCLQLQGDQSFPYLRNAKNADGFLLVEDASGQWTAHVVECKVTLTTGSWTKAREQLRASLVRLEIVAAFLGLSIQQRKGWIAFRENRLDAAFSTNPASFKLPTAAAQADWMRSTIQDAPLAGVLPFETIHLDPITGAARRTLD